MRAHACTTILSLAALSAAGCSQTFTPPSVVEDLRVLAIVANPPELGNIVADPSASSTMQAIVARPYGASTPVVETWSFCPFSAGASTGYACAVPQCETVIRTTIDESPIVVTPAALVAACVNDHRSELPPGFGGGVSLPARVEVIVRLHVDDGVGPPRDAVQRLPVWTQPPTEPLNEQPRFGATPVTLDGAAAVPCADSTPTGLATCASTGMLRRGANLPIVAAIDPSSIQQIAAGDRTVDEAFGLRFFTTAGRFTYQTGGATRDVPTSSTELKYEEVAAGTTEALLWVVLRDLRGGEAVAGPYKLDVEP
jgi:hypothetical protein